MRRVVAYLLMSLDGVTDSPDQWLFEFDAEMLENLEDVIARQDDILLGRVTYDEWSEYWPTATDEPFASFINGTPKHIATTNPGVSLDWESSSILLGDLSEYVNKLKSQPGRDIGVHGSTTLVQALLNRDLIDELQLVVAPSIAGHGRRLFDATTSIRKLSLTHAAHSSTGSLLLSYDIGDNVSP